MFCEHLSLRLQFILQWSTGILVLICCFLERKQFSVEISSKLGSSFSMAPFVIVVVSIVFPLLCVLCDYCTAITCNVYYLSM
jgi:hypothetical protein